MSHLRQVLFGIGAALLSAGIVLGSFSIALTEGADRVAVLPSPVVTETRLAIQSPVILPTLTPTKGASPSPTLATSTTSLATPTPSPSPTLTPSATATFTEAPPTDCPVPGGWVTLQVVSGDTLKSLAEKYNSTEQALMQANCLVVETLIPGTLLYVPGLPPTSQPDRCGAPSRWVIYTVQSGDTLYRLSRELGVSVAQLQNANCLGNSTLIRNGQKLYVPFLPSRPAIPSPTTTQLPATPTSEPASPTVTLVPPALTATFQSPVPTSTIPPTPSPAPTEAQPTEPPLLPTPPGTSEIPPETEEPVIPAEP
jgi:LysM repeat protein